MADAKADGSLNLMVSIRRGESSISSVSRANTEKLAMLEEQAPLDDAMAAEEAKEK